MENNYIEKKGKWTLEELAQHIKINSDDTYSLIVPLAALLKKFYGIIPDIGLSGFQGGIADKLAKLFPNSSKKMEKNKHNFKWNVLIGDKCYYIDIIPYPTKEDVKIILKLIFKKLKNK